MGVFSHQLPTVDVRGGKLLQFHMYGGERSEVIEVYLVECHDKDGALIGHHAWYRYSAEVIPVGEAGGVLDVVKALYALPVDARGHRHRAHQLTRRSAPGKWLGSSWYLRRRE